MVNPILDRGFLLTQTVKNLPAMWETQVRSLGQKDPLEKGMAAHSSILDWRIPWSLEFQRSLAGYGPQGHKELDRTEQLTHTHSFHIFVPSSITVNSDES